jgi:S1-C subfamily serine protease
VQPDRVVADSLLVTTAGERMRAAVIAVASPDSADLALLRLRDYRGAHIEDIDWSGSGAVQGEAVALIGFTAAGASAADAVFADTSMVVGTLTVTSEAIRFDGFGIAGSRGSPIFNAAGEVVAVKGESFRGAGGPGSAVQIKELIPLMPAEVKSELGIN